MVVDKLLTKNAELQYRRRFRALAKYHYNAGHEIVEHTEREDIDNMHQKERYRLAEDTENPLYPGIDKVRLPYTLRHQLLYRKDRPKIGRFGL